MRPLATTALVVAAPARAERAVSALGLDQIGFEGSDSLDDRSAVFR